MARVAADSTARALQYGPTEGMTATMECIVQVMAEEGTTVGTDEMIVTTGGQQVIDLVCKTLIDPGDVIVAEAPTYPGAVPTFGAYQANVVQIEMDEEGMPIDALEATLDRLQAEGRRPKFIYTIPNFQNPGGVTMSLERRRRLVEIARERELLVLEDNPYGLLRYEGEPLPTLYSLDAACADHKGSSDFVIYLGTFSKILSPGIRLGWAVAPRPVLEKLNLGKQGADLCSSPVTQLFVAAYFREHDWRGYLNELKDLYRSRRDAMFEALTEHFGPGARWTRPQGGLFIWATLPEYVDTTNLLAQCHDVAFVPGRAAYMDAEERRGSSSMRLNFAGLAEEHIREGIRRIGRAMGGETGLFSALTGSAPVGPPRRPVAYRHGGLRGPFGRGEAGPVGDRTDERRGLRSKATERRRGGHLRVAGRADTRRTVAVLQGGRSLERTVSLRSGARAREALERLGYTVIAIDAGPELLSELLEYRPHAAFVTLHGRDGEDGTVQGLLEAIGIPYTGSGPAGCMRCTDKALAKYLMREAGIPTPDFHAFKESAIKELGVAAALPGIERELGFPMVVKPASQGSALGVNIAQSSDDLPRAILAALSYDSKVVLERYVKGRDLAVSVLDSGGGGSPTGEPVALPVIEAIPREQEFYAYESRYEIGMTTFVCPAELPAEIAARAQQLALETYRLLGCHGVARIDLMLPEESEEPTVLEANVVPGLTETSLLPQAADAAGIGFDALAGRILQSAFTR